MKPYKPSNIVPTSAYPILLLSAILSGGLIGAAVSFIGRFIYLIILFPLMMGFGGAAANAVAVRQGKVRNPLVAGLFGILTGCSIYGAMQYADYLNFRRMAAADLREEYAAEIQQAVRESDGIGEEAVVQNAIDNLLVEVTGHSGPIGYLYWSAQQGFELTGRSSSSGAPVSGTFVWVYWAIELGIIVFISAVGSAGIAAEPFCEKGNVWYGNRERLGNVSAAASEEFIAALDRNSYETAGSFIVKDGDIEVPSLEVHVRKSPKDRSADVILVLSKTSLDKHNNIQLTEVLKGAIAQRELRQLERPTSSAEA